MNRTLFQKIKKNYWACATCMSNAGGVYPQGHICTMMEGDCKTCDNKNTTLIPWVDYNWLAELEQYFKENIEDVPKEFEETFKKNFKDILA